MQITFTSWSDVESYILHSYKTLSESYSSEEMRFMLARPEYIDAFSKGQRASKMWLLHELRPFVSANSSLDVCVCGGWLGTLAKLLLDVYPDWHIRSLDIDMNAVADSLEYVNHENFEAQYSDFVFYQEYANHDLIINTSFEHESSYKYWFLMIPAGKLVVIQSNNYKIPEHVNIDENLEQFLEKVSPYIDPHYVGEMKMVDMYDRFMIIGTRR